MVLGLPVVMGPLLFMGQSVCRLSDWDSAMEHSEPGQVGNQAAISHPFLVPEPTPADGFLSCVLCASFASSAVRKFTAKNAKIYARYAKDRQPKTFTPCISNKTFGK